MPAVFQWLPWARTTGRPPSSSVKLRKAIYVARVASNKDDGVDNSGEPQFLYGAALDHHGGAEFIEADGKIRNETEYEVLMPPDLGYYWVPNRPGLVPSGAFQVNPWFLHEYGTLYLARVYKSGGNESGVFYVGYATVNACFYQVPGSEKFNSTDNFEILAALPPFVMSSIMENKTLETETGGSFASGSGHFEKSDEYKSLSIGWVPWTEKINRRFLVSAGSCSTKTTFVARHGSLEGYLTVDFVIIDKSMGRAETFPSTGGALTEVLLSRPGGYMWVERANATELYVKHPHESPDDSSVIDEAWDRRMRRADDGGPSTEWDYWIGRFLRDKIVYRVGHTAYDVCQPREHVPSEIFDCLVFTCKPTHRQIPPARAIGWIPLNDAEHLSWAHAILGMDLQDKDTADVSVRKRLIIVRETTATTGHSIYELDPSQVIPDCGDGRLEVLWGSEGSTEWVSDRAGYVPHGAITGGETSDGGLFYIGRVQSSEPVAKTDFHVGTVLPPSKCLRVNRRAHDNSMEQFRQYEVLCVRNAFLPRTVMARPQSSNWEDANLKIIQTSLTETLLVELQDLQKDELHGQGNLNSNEKARGAYNGKISKILLEAGLETLTTTGEWIPYVSRLARLNGLPSSVWKLLFQYIEFLEEDKSHLKIRLASIMTHAIRAARNVRLDDLQSFSPILQYISTLPDPSADLSVPILEALVEFLTSYTSAKSVQRDWLRHILSPQGWLCSLVEGCLKKLDSRSRDELASCLSGLGMKTLKLNGTRMASSADGNLEKMVELKRESLSAVRTKFMRQAPLRNTVFTLHLQHAYQSSFVTETASEFEQLNVNQVPHLYQESLLTHGMSWLPSEQESRTEDIPTESISLSEILDKPLESHTLDYAAALCDSLTNPQSSLGSTEMHELQSKITGASLAQQGINNELCWVIVLSLAKLDQDGLPENQVKELLLEITPTLMKHAAALEDLVLVEAILSALKSAAEKKMLPLRQSEFAQLITILKSMNMTDSSVNGCEYRRMAIARLALSILCEQPNLFLLDSTLSTNAAVLEVLEKSEDKACRILAAKYIAQVTADHEQSLEVEQLDFLTTLLEDPVRDVRVYSRGAFANGLWNNRNGQNELLDSMIQKYFHQMFATQPLLILTPGRLPVAAEDFTEKINGRLLDIVKDKAQIPLAFWDRVCKFIDYCANFNKKNSPQTSRTLIKALEQLSVLDVRKEADIPGEITAAEKIFLKAALEDDNEELAIACLAFIVESIERNRHETEHYQASERLLQTISTRMIRMPDPIYPQCLHALTSIQEIPQDLFPRYHLEMACVRMEPEPKPNVKSFLKSHGLDVPEYAISSSLLARHINYHYRSGGLLVSTRAAKLIVNCLKKNRNDEALWSCIQSMADATYFFKPDELSELFASRSFQQVMTPSCHRACLRIIQNQGLPPSISNEILSLILKSNNVTTSDPLELAQYILSTHDDPARIVSPLISIGIQAMEETHDDPLFSFKARKLIKRVLEATKAEGMVVVSQDLANALKSKILKSWSAESQTIAKPGHFPPKSDGKPYGASDRSSEGYVSNLELLLLLISSCPNQFICCWDEVNGLAATEGPFLLSLQSNACLEEIFHLWHSATRRMEFKFLKRPNYHVLFHIIHLQFGQDPQALIESLCSYIRDSSDHAADAFILQPHHTQRIQPILQQNDWQCQRVLQALEETQAILDGHRLQALGDSVFIAWSRGSSRQVEETCQKILHALVTKGWKLVSGHLTEHLEILVRLLGENNLGIPAADEMVADKSRGPFWWSDSSRTEEPSPEQSVNSNEEDDEVEDEGDGSQPPDFLHYISQDTITTLGVKDLSARVLFYLVTMDIYDSIREQAVATDPEVALQRLISRVINESDTKMLTAYFQLQRIQFYLRKSTEPVQVESYEFLSDAAVFSLGHALHNKFPREKREGMSKCGSLLLASDLLTACRENADQAHVYIEQMGEIQDHEQVSSFTDLVSFLKEPLEKRRLIPPAAGKANPKELEVELTLKYIRIMLCHVQEKVPRIEGNLRNLLKAGTLTWKHFKSLPCPLLANLAEENLDRFSRLVLCFKFTNIHVDFLQIHKVDFFESEQFQSQVLSELLTQNYKKGTKEDQRIVEEFLKLNKGSTAAQKYDKISLLHLLKQVRRGLTETGPNSDETVTSISEWSKENIGQWAAAKVKAQNRPLPDTDFIPEYISVARRAVQLVKGWKLTTIQILSTFLALQNEPKKSQDGRKGQFFQVSTGSGKSAIIAIVAAAKVLLSNLRVDIHTHNPLLARRDAEDWSEFYQLVHIQCSHNVEEKLSSIVGDYVGGHKGCYTSSVVYGDTRDFQFDALRTEYLGLGTRGDRPYECVVLDEVDSIYIDDAEKLTVLSSPIAGMHLIQPLYHQIWEKARALDKSTNLVQIGQSFFTYKGTFELDEISKTRVYICKDSAATEEELLELTTQQLSDEKKAETLASLGIFDRRTFMKDALIDLIRNLIKQNGNDLSPVPKNLMQFIETQVDNWSESALTAMTLEEGKEYVINTESKQILPLDPSNGTTMSISSWSHGLHQFLQIKHSLEFRSEALQTAYLSNQAIMGKYIEGELVGLSGTLQETDGFFRKACGIEILKIPDLHHNCLSIFPEVVTRTREKWTDEILTSVEEQTNNKMAVLIICESIKVAVSLRDTIVTSRNANPNPSAPEEKPIILHVRSDDSQDRNGIPEDWRAGLGQVIITTLLGARGMDIKGGEIEPYGGLHVILTFLLPNRRLEAQALGRTARQGNYGSAQYILHVHDSSTDFDALVAQRDVCDSSYVFSLEKSVYPMISAKDEAFKAYAAAFRAMYDILLNKGPGRHIKLALLGHSFTQLDWALLDAYQEYWAIHLARTTTRKSKEISSNIVDEKLMKMLQFVKPDELFKKHESVIDPESVFKLTGSCFYPTRYGFHCYRENKFLPFMETTDEVKAFFQLAIQLDEGHAAGAQVGLAYLELLGDKRYFKFPSHAKGYKDRAIDYLQTALNIITAELSSFQGISDASTEFVADEATNLQSRPHLTPYENQLYERLDVSKRYAGILLSTLETVRSTQRPVIIRREDLTSSSVKEWLTRAYERAPTGVLVEDHDTVYTLTCAGLRWKKDIRAEHEVEAGLLAIKRNPKFRPEVMVTVSLGEQSTSCFRALASSNSKWVTFGDNTSQHLGTEGIKLGQNPQSLKLVPNVPAMKDMLTGHLATAKEIVLELPAPDLTKLLRFFRHHGIHVDKITVHDLDRQEAASLLKALPKRKDPMAQLSMYQFSDLYTTKFKPLTVLCQLQQQGLGWIANFDELNKFRVKSASILGILALVEIVAAAAALLSTGAAAPFLVPLLAGGAAKDLWTLSSLFSRNFSWKSYGVAKVLGIAFAIGIPGIEALVPSTTLAEESVAKIVEKVGNTSVSALVSQYGPSALKLLISQAGGPLMKYLGKKERKAIYVKVEKVVVKFVEEEKMSKLLNHFRAIERLKCGDDSLSDHSLQQLLHTWAASKSNQVNWRWHKLKESLYGSLEKQAAGVLPEIAFSGSLCLLPLIATACELIWKHLKVEDMASTACEALEEELDKYVSHFDLRYILIKFCGLSQDQVTRELKIPSETCPPVLSYVLPAGDKDLATVTGKQLSEAQAVLGKFQRDLKGNMAISQFASSLSNFITDHIIGVFSSVIFHQFYSKSLTLGNERHWNTGFHAKASEAILACRVQL